MIAVTPPKSSSPLAAIPSRLDESDDGLTPQLTSSRYSSSFSLSAGISSSWWLPEGAKREPKQRSSSSIGSLFSTLTRGWNRGAGRKGMHEIMEDSPRTIVESPRGLPKRGKAMDGQPGRIAEAIRLERALFESLDGEDAREFEEFVEEGGGERCGMPVLCLESYGGHGEFAGDVWVLMHNTVRRELFDLFEIVGMIRKGFVRMKMEDMYNLRKWWRFFGVMCGEFWAHENERIAPMVEQICSVDGRADVFRGRLRGLREMREWLGLKMEEITAYVEEFEKIGRPGRALSLICRNIELFAAKVVVYFGGMERLLPRIAEEYYEREVCKGIEDALVARLRRSEYFEEMIVAMMRWMDVGVKARWMEEHLFWGERQALERFERKFEVSHGCIVTCFKDLMLNSDSL